MNQSNTERITRLAIEPLEYAFDRKYQDNMARMLIEDLSHYTDETLRKAVKSLRHSQAYLPKIKHIIDACNDNLPPPPKQAKEQKDQSFHCREHAEKVHPNKVRQILSTPAGKLALQLGVAWDLLVNYEKTGQTDFSENHVRKASQSFKQTASDILRLKEKNEKLAGAYEDLYKAIEQREKKLYATYS